MQVTETQIDELTHEFRIAVPADDVETKISDRLVKLSHTVSLPGFRPGKVPTALLRKRYGDALRGEVVEETVNEISKSLITDRGFRPAAPPRVEMLEQATGRDLQFTMAVEVLPEITPADFSTISVERLVAAVDDTEVDAQLQNLAKALAAVPQQGAVEAAGDAASEGEVSPEGDSATADASIATADNVPIDDALAQRLGVESLSELRERVREHHAQDLKTLSRIKLKRALLDKIDGLYAFPVPRTLVEREYQAVVRSLAASKEAGGDADTALAVSDAEAMATEHHHHHVHDETCTHDHDHAGHNHDLSSHASPSDAPDPEAALSESEREEYVALAQRRVRLGLILADIGRRNSIAVAPDELNKALIGEARRYPGQEHAVLEFLRKSEEAKEALAAPILEEKVIDFILELAQVSERQVSATELLRDDDGDHTSVEAADSSERSPMVSD